MKLVQLNIWHARRYDAVVAFLRDQDPDIITLQEVTSYSENWGERAMDVFEQLKTDLGLREGANAPAFFREGQPPGYHGNAILSRFPLISSQVHFLSGRYSSTQSFAGNWLLEPRNTLQVLLQTGAGSLRVFSTHLTFSPGFETSPVQMAQAGRLARLLQRGRGQNTPTILAGDLNTLPGSPVIQLLERQLHNQSSGQPLLTFARQPFIFGDFRVDGLRYQVDYVFTGPHIQPLSIQAVDVECSDHLPLVFTFNLLP